MTQQSESPPNIFYQTFVCFLLTLLIFPQNISEAISVSVLTLKPAFLIRTLTGVPSVLWGLLWVQQGQRVGLTVSATGTQGGAYCECNRDRVYGLLWVQQGQMLGLTVRITGTEVGAYYECNRDTGWGLLCVQQGHRLGLTVSATGTEVRQTYCWSL